jgi:glycosyltransferase involved in cell wall biosynthesis
MPEPRGRARRTRAGKPTVALVGPAPPSRGGIASAVAAIGGSELLAARYRFVVVRTHGTGSRLAKSLRASSGLLRLALLVWSRRVDLVHVHASANGSFRRKALASGLARSARLPVLFHVHSSAFPRELELPGRRGGLRRRLRVAVLMRADAVAVLTDGWAAELARHAPRADLRVIPNGIAVGAATAGAREEPGLVAFLGDLKPEKGVHELVEAIALARARGHEVRAVLAGEGPSREALERRARALGLLGDGIVLPGWLGPADKERLLARASCFCLPSHGEGLPLALLEAMAAGKAVVASRVGGIPEVARPGREALLVPPREVEALAAALARVAGDADLRQRLGAAARERVRAEFSESVVAERLGAIYGELLLRHRSAHPKGDAMGTLVRLLVRLERPAAAVLVPLTDAAAFVLRRGRHSSWRRAAPLARR